MNASSLGGVRVCYIRARFVSYFFFESEAAFNQKPRAKRVSAHVISMFTVLPDRISLYFFVYAVWQPFYCISVILTITVVKLYYVLITFSSSLHLTVNAPTCFSHPTLCLPRRAVPSCSLKSPGHAARKLRECLEHVRAYLPLL